MQPSRDHAGAALEGPLLVQKIYLAAGQRGQLVPNGLFLALERRLSRVEVGQEVSRGRTRLGKLRGGLGHNESDGLGPCLEFEVGLVDPSRLV
jgi:hypothetical protein